MVNSPHMELPNGSSDLGGKKESSSNIGSQGAKLMATELTFGNKFVTFSTQEQAEQFIESYWRTNCIETDTNNTLK